MASLSSVSLTRPPVSSRHLCTRSPFQTPLRNPVRITSTSTRKPSSFCFQAKVDGDEDYFLDAPVSIGDGFSFSGGKYSDEPSKSDEWYKKGRIVKAYASEGKVEKAKDPIFGLAMGSASQISIDAFRWFCIESGKQTNTTVVLVHGFPSQSYSYRKVLSVLSVNYHAIAFDWIGFGFSDKPQPGYGFEYTLDEYVSALDAFLTGLALDNYSLVVQGYFAPVVIKYASAHQDKLNKIILVNPPLIDKHTVLPSTLSVFSNFLFGEIFAQDPLRASDKALTSSGPYMMKEEDAMVYRRPYLVSGSSGFALTAISRSMKKELKKYVQDAKEILCSNSWRVDTTICWGLRDRWLSYSGVEDFCRDSKHTLVELQAAGHHAQEDSGEELGKIVNEILRKK